MIKIFTIFILLNSNFALPPPIAKKLPHEIKMHNETRNDDYFWMNQRDDEWVLEYLHSENNYRDQILAHTVELQEILYKEMTNRIP